MHGLHTLSAADIPWVVQWLSEEAIPEPDTLRQALTAGQVVGLWYYGTYLGCGGLQPCPWPGVWHVWILPAHAVLLHPRYAVFHMRRMLRELQARYTVRRFQTLAKTDWPEACRLVEVLGFEVEGYMHDLLPGETYTMYALIVKG